MMEYEEGGLSDQGGTIDPVSGNEVPPGALQEEVRDDIDAKLSEGEFVFPADVVRYIGLEKLMMMRQQAKQGLSMMEKMGQMSNADEAVMEDTAPAAVFDIPDDMDMPAVMVAELEMAEGGDVQGQRRYKSFRELMGTEGDTAEIVTYVNDAGRKIIIMHLNGSPVSDVPDGFYPEGSDPPADDDGTDDGTTPPADPPAPPQVQQQQEESGNEPPVKSGAVITTGGYIDSKAGRVVGGDQWNVSYSFDGSVTLENPEHGKVTLTKEEAAGIGVGLDISKAGFGAALAAFTPKGMQDRRERQATLSSGEFGNPASGNEIHKALIEKAQLQKKGEEFVKNNSAKMSFGDTVASVFGQGKPNEIEGSIAQILGKDSSQFTASDYAIIGQALSGTPNVYNLPGATQTDAAKLKQIADVIYEIESGQFSDMTLPQSKPSSKTGGLSTPTISEMANRTNDGSGPPVFRPKDQDPGDAGGGPNINNSYPIVSQPADPAEQDGGPGVNTTPASTSQVLQTVSQNLSEGSDEIDRRNSYSIGSGAPVDAFNERPGLGSSSRGSSGGSYFSDISSSYYNKGSLVKKRRGLASR